jgi:hypothetical protein
MLLKGETREVRIEFDEEVLGNDSIKLIADPYNNNIEE